MPQLTLHFEMSAPDSTVARLAAGLNRVWRNTRESDPAVSQSEFFGCVLLDYDGHILERSPIRSCDAYLCCFVRWVIAYELERTAVWMRADDWPGRTPYEIAKRSHKRPPKPIRILFHDSTIIGNDQRLHVKYVWLDSIYLCAQDIHIAVNGHGATMADLKTIDKALAWKHNISAFSRMAYVNPNLIWSPDNGSSSPSLTIHFDNVDFDTARNVKRVALRAAAFKTPAHSYTYNLFSDSPPQVGDGCLRYMGLVAKFVLDGGTKTYREDRAPAHNVYHDIINKAANDELDWLSLFFGDDRGWHPISIVDYDSRQKSLCLNVDVLNVDNIEIWYQAERILANSPLRSEFVQVVADVTTLKREYRKKQNELDFANLSEGVVRELKYWIVAFITLQIRSQLDASRIRDIIESELMDLENLTSERIQAITNQIMAARRLPATESPAIQRLREKVAAEASKERYFTSKIIGEAARRVASEMYPRLQHQTEPIGIKEHVAAVMKRIVDGSTDFTIELQSSVLSVEEMDRLAMAFGLEPLAESEISEPLRCPSLEIYPHDPTSTEIRRFVAAQYEPYEPTTLRGNLVESLSLLWNVVTLPRCGLTAALMRFYFSPTLMAGTQSSSPHQPDEVAAERASKRALLNAVIFWPLLTAMIALAIVPLITGHATFSTDLWIATGATLMGLAGSLVCGPLFNVLGVGTGTVFIGLCFAVVQALLVRWCGGFQSLVHPPQQTDAFTTVVMGVIGMSASRIAGAAQKVVLLATPAIGIVATASRMNQPHSDEPDTRRSDARILAGAITGMLGGGCIGLVFLLFNVILKGVADQALRFCAAAVPIAAAAYGSSVWLRLNRLPARVRRTRSLLWGMGCAAMCGVLWYFALSNQGTPEGLFVCDLGTASFHAVFFTLSFAIGFRIAGWRAGTIAAAFEGVGGFVIANSILLSPMNILWLLIAAGAAVVEALLAWVTVCITEGSRNSAISDQGGGLDRVIGPDANKATRAAVSRIGSCLPPLTLAIAVGVLAAFHLHPAQMKVAARATHYFGIVLLFLFLFVSLVFQIESWSKMRRSHSLESLAITYHNWWVAVKLAPAPAALCILVGGLGLVNTSPDTGTLENGWLFWLIVSFSFFFFDGLTFYLPEISYRYAALRQAIRSGLTLDEYSTRHRTRFSELMLLVHALSFPFVFAIAAANPPNMWSPKSPFRWIYQHFDNIHNNRAHVAGVLVLVLVVGIAILLFRIFPLYNRVMFLRGVLSEEEPQTVEQQV